MKSAAVTVATTATLLASSRGSAQNPGSILVHNLSGNETVYVGGSDVTTANGMPVAAGATLGWDLMGEALYGIVAADTEEVRVLRRGA